MRILIGIVMLTIMSMGCSTLGPNQTLNMYSANITVEAAQDQPLNIVLGFNPAAGGIPTNVDFGTQLQNVDKMSSAGTGFILDTNGRCMDLRVQADGYFTIDGRDNSTAHGLNYNISSDGSWFKSLWRDNAAGLPEWEVGKAAN